MRLLISVVFLLSGFSAFALESPFPSDIPELDIPNASYVNGGNQRSGMLLRGMAPLDRTDAQQLVDLGVDHILIFKKSGKRGAQKNAEIRAEKKLLSEAGYDYEQMTHIPFPWKNVRTDAEKQLACEQLVQAVELIEKKLEAKQKVFFHCTVGEDRTGLLAGLIRIKNHGWDVRKAFKYEMCENGYEHGNYTKPYHPVVLPIRESLTPLFWEMAFILEERPWKWGRSMCKRLGESRTYRKKWKPELEYLTCSPSSSFPYKEE